MMRIYVKRTRTFGLSIGFYRRKGKGMQGFCGEMPYNTWLERFQIPVKPGQQKLIEFREVVAGIDE